MESGFTSESKGFTRRGMMRGIASAVAANGAALAAPAAASAASKPPEAQVHELERFVIGEDPLHPERLWQKMHKGLFLGSNVAMSGITIACWDILAKSLNAPLWKLLGGKQHPALRVYANGWYKGPREPAASE